MRKMKSVAIKLLLVIAGWPLLAIGADGEGAPAPEDGLPIRYLGEYPSATEPDFANNIQGLAHDGTHWYITQIEDLWKFPMSMNWNDVDDSLSNVLHTTLDDYIDGPPYVHPDFNHMGDLEHHDSCGVGVLIVPLHGQNGRHSAFLVIRASTLEGIGYVEFDSKTHNLAGWCAIDRLNDKESVVYTTGQGHANIKGYKLDCVQLRVGRVAFDFVAEYTLLDEQGAPLERHHKQSGVFSSDGKLFVLGTGYELENSDPILDGLHVFDTDSWQRIAHSTNGGGLFNYQWNPNEIPEGEEPEGMTWLDLDDGSVPGMSGQLHVLLLDNDTWDSDNIHLKHYTSRIYADARSLSGDGTVAAPYPTVGEANNLAWNRCEVRIMAGSYDETLTLSTRMKVVADGGTAVIGEMGRFP